MTREAFEVPFFYFTILLFMAVGVAMLAHLIRHWND